MKFANKISLRVFCHPEEDVDEINKAFLDLLGFSAEEIEEQKIPFRKIDAKGFQQKSIVIFEADLLKDRHCNGFLKRLSHNLSYHDKEMMKDDDLRLDDNLDFFIRLDKAALEDKKYVVTDSGECFHVKISVSAFPKNRVAAWKTIETFLS